MSISSRQNSVVPCVEGPTQSAWWVLWHATGKSICPAKLKKPSAASCNKQHGHDGRVFGFFMGKGGLEVARSSYWWGDNVGVFGDYWKFGEREQKVCKTTGKLQFFTCDSSRRPAESKTWQQADEWKGNVLWLTSVMGPSATANRSGWHNCVSACFVRVSGYRMFFKKKKNSFWLLTQIKEKNSLWLLTRIWKFSKLPDDWPQPRHWRWQRVCLGVRFCLW